MRLAAENLTTVGLIEALGISSEREEIIVLKVRRNSTTYVLVRSWCNALPEHQMALITSLRAGLHRGVRHGGCGGGGGEAVRRCALASEDVLARSSRWWQGVVGKINCCALGQVNTVNVATY